MNHIKKMWGHYLSLLLLIATLTYPVYRVFKFFQSEFGQEVALIALTLTIIIALIFVIRGAVHTHRLVREINQDVEKQNGRNHTPNVSTPLIFKLFKIDPSTRKQTKSIEESLPGTVEFPPQFERSVNRHRGKPPRFPKEQIRKAVLKWERRDPSITALTLEQFLAQEFGSSPDGILLMATTTFYDWRRRILNEIKSSEHQQ